MTFTTRFHRTTALAAGAFVGLAAFAAPASATPRVPVVAATATLTSSVSCTPNGWKVRWNLKTAQTDGAVGVFSNIKPSVTVLEMPPGSGGPQPKTTPPPLTTFIDGGKVTGDREVTEDQSFTSLAVTVELKLSVTWLRGTYGYVRANVQATATAPRECREADPPDLTVVPPPPELPADTDVSDTGVETPGHTSTPESPSPSSRINRSASASAPEPASVSPSPIPSPSPSRTTEPAGAGNGDSGEKLVLTGAAAGPLGGGAAVLLLIGLAVYLMARRRKMKFTA